MVKNSSQGSNMAINKRVGTSSSINT
jgi:hypothetical protein